jgi:adenosylhomocysteine nucleosidase
MTIGIIGAMEEEVVNLRESMEVISAKNVVGLDFYLGKLSGNNVVVVRSGIGKVNAAICAQVLVDMYAVDCIINVGVAGALDKSLTIGDIVISSDAVQHDFDTSALGDEPGVISRMDISVFPADEGLVNLAKDTVESLGYPVYVGRVASGDQFVSSDEVKARIKKMFNASCCEMEGAAVAHAAYLNKIPFVVIRAISDNADDSGDVDYDRFFRESALKAASIIKKMIEKIDN